MKNKRVIFTVSTFLITFLLLSISTSIFAQGRWNTDNRGPSGKIKEIYSVQISVNDWKIVKPAFQEYVDSIINLINKEKELGLISKYQAIALIDQINEIEKKVNKNRNFPLIQGFGYFRNFKPMGGPIRGNYKIPGQPPMPGRPLYFQHFPNPQITDSQWNALVPFIKKLSNSQTNLYKKLLDIGFITKTQYDNYVKIHVYITDSIIKNKALTPMFGISFLFKLNLIN